ncbi:MAG: response regulator [Fibrobacteria bacterium]|nr:response regulator [Fibrobacteria bacterium]
MPDTILLIDDDESLLFGYKVEMELEGFCLQAITNLFAAKELLTTRRFNTVITDLNLSGTESYEGLEIIALAKQYQSKATIIVVSGISDENIKKKSLEVGANAYLEKPVKAKTLLNFIRRQVAEAGEMQ